ncbi:unnamed protein product [Urochloa humidicola]
MELDDCNYYFWRLASRSLRRLSMENCRPAYDVDELVLVAPRIDSLRIRGNSSAPVTSEGDMPVLVTASLTDPAGDRGLLRSLRHARSLNLSRFSTAALLLGGEDDSGDLFPVFHNLRTLVLDRCDVGVECQVLKRFLRSAPSLETLTLRDCAFSGGSRSKKRKASSGENTSSSACECRSLRWIEVEFCEGHAVDELVRALVDIPKEMSVQAQPMQSSAQHKKRKVKISYA